MNRILIASFSLFIVDAVILSNEVKAQDKEQVLHGLNALLLNAVMEDMFTPPIAGRIYAYPNIAFYECVNHLDTSCKSLGGVLNGLTVFPQPQIFSKTDYFVAAAFSFSFVAQDLVGSGQKFIDWRKKFVNELSGEYDQDVVLNSVKYGRTMADTILAWAKRDNFFEAKAPMKKNPADTVRMLRPALSINTIIEPQDSTIRPMILKSSSQFAPQKKLEYNSDKASEFYKNVEEVYAIDQKNDSLKQIALFWDDNPNMAEQKGAVKNDIHKISPGGHWIMIARQACLRKNIPLARASMAYTLTSISIFDAFVASWDEKFKSKLVRPEVAINKRIDRKWTPLVQTPPVPEFPSAHAIVSNAAAAVLTSIFGEQFVLTDSTESPFGIASRNFSSFYEAADEASRSRVYGGINYPETVRISMDIGKKIGKYVVDEFYGKRYFKK